MGKCLMLCFLMILIAGTAKAVDPALAIYLPLDEGKGDTVADGSGNGNDGLLEDRPDWVDGRFGKALEFENGSRVHISASDSLHGNIFKENFTLLAWIKPLPDGNDWGHIWRSVDGNDATQYTCSITAADFFPGEARSKQCGQNTARPSPEQSTLKSGAMRLSLVMGPTSEYI